MPTGHKHPGILVAEIKMARQARNCSFLMVEGGDDVRFWYPRKHSECELIDGEGKPNVLEAINRLDRGHVGGVLGIVDEDYDGVLGNGLSSSNLVAVSPHDLECLLCHTTALDKVLAEFGTPEKLVAFTTSSGDVRDALLERALVFGQLRWAALACGLSIDVKNIRVPRFLDEETWAVDRRGLVDVAAAGLERELEDCMGRLPAAQSWRLVTGHDVLDVLRIGLKRVLGDLTPSVGVKEIARVLRAAGDIAGTTVLEEIRSWEGANRPYQVLKLEAGAGPTVRLGLTALGP